MRCLFKGLFRTTLLGAALLAAVAGGAAMVVGPDRVEAAIDQATGRLEQLVDDRIEDPVALRQKLATLQRRYPERISQVRQDMTELTREIARLEQERAVSARAVELIDNDLAALGPAVDEARERQDGRAALAAVAFDDEVLSLPNAKSKLEQMRRSRLGFASRAADAEHNLKYLRQQETRFDELLQQLETENTQLTLQLVQLEREVESIARNERLIELLEKRQRTLDEASRYEAVSLGGITSELARIRTEQEARLDHLAASRDATNYEDMAKSQLAEETAPRAQVLHSER
jgi:chromosome segregation ATPase